MLHLYEITTFPVLAVIKRMNFHDQSDTKLTDKTEREAVAQTNKEDSIKAAIFGKMTSIYNQV